MNVSLNPSEQYSLSNFKNNRMEYACDEKSCPLWRWGLLDAKFIHSDGQCNVFVYASGANQVRYGKLIEDNPELFGESTNLSFKRIKRNLGYGKKGASPSEREIEDMKMMLTYYPADSAKVMFNADYMVSYPFNMEGKKCQDIYSSTRVIVFGKNGLDIFLYFVMTEDGAKNFNKYLTDFKEVLWYNKEENTNEITGENKTEILLQSTRRDSDRKKMEKEQTGNRKKYL
ncbi:hypothetical protein LJB98_05235 [Bacteroidales bacterium OttesenSCG-928-M11]|nr:hypothetical protein [Bacteroidales bacterium OttesenSCG-928-M11]